MSFTERQLTRIPNLRDGISLLPVPVAGVGMDVAPVLPQRIRLKLSAFSVSLLAANDFGSAKLCDLPASNLVIHGAVVDLTSTQTGFASNAGTAVTMAIGTVATASTNFANAGEKNILGAITGTGAGSPGAEKGSSQENGAVIDVLLAPGAKALYLNVGDPVTAGTGVVAFSGVIDVYYTDLGSHS